jgi:hypothetical protein
MTTRLADGKTLAPQRKAAPVGGDSRAPSPNPNPLAVALGVFDRAASGLGLTIEDRLKLLNLGRSKYFELRVQVDPVLDVDRRDRLGYFLAIYELSGRLVGAPGAWLKAANRAPLFSGKPPLERILRGRMEDLIATLTYLQGTYGGWA